MSPLTCHLLKPLLNTPNSSRIACRHTGNLPDIFFIVHDKTEHEEENSPYYACKALLLRRGVMTQNVTVDLIRNSSQFQRAASNIGLAAFAKLGGILGRLNRRQLEKVS